MSTSNSFALTFSFSLAMLDVNPMADGISFAMRNVGTNPIGGGGGDIGYTGLGAVGSIVQTWVNNRVGLYTDGNAFHAQAAPANLGLFPVAYLPGGADGGIKAR